MKKLIHISLMLCLALGMTSCAKVKSLFGKKETKAPEKIVKTVDLGEVEEDADKPAPEQPETKKNKARDKAPRDDSEKPKAPEEDKPESENADNAPDDPTPSEPVAEEEKKTADNKDGGFDFSDDPPAKPMPKPARPKSSLNVDKLLNISELRKQTGYTGAFVEAPLQGQTMEPRFDFVRYAPDDPSKLGFALQVWKPGNESNASKRFNDLYTQSFGGQKVREIASDAFVSSHHKINELGFFDKGKRSTVLMSCSEDICSIEQLKSMAQIIQRRL